MARRKSRRPKPEPKKKPKLETSFSCPFCNHDESVECVIDLKHGFAKASCSVCKESYHTSRCHALTEPVDVYAEWIDECEKANDGVVVRRPAADDDDEGY